MSRTPRQQSESGVYHVYSRGSGRQIIFEDNGDRRMFLDCLEQAISKADATLLAYCLMGNHYHLVLKSDFGKLSEMAHRLNRSYAAYFNREHDRSGHLFQQRFGSQAIDDDVYVVRLLLVDFGEFVDWVRRAVDSHAGEAVALHGGKRLLVASLLAFYERRI